MNFQKLERFSGSPGILKLCVSSSRQYLTRVSKLKEQREHHKNILSDVKEQRDKQQDESGSADSEDELDDILNWRAKKA